MKAWDDCICGERGRVSEESMVATRTNTVPIAFQEVGQDDSEAVFQEFLKSSTFANIWDSVPSLLSSPTVAAVPYPPVNLLLSSLRSHSNKTKRVWDRPQLKYDCAALWMFP